MITGAKKYVGSKVGMDIATIISEQQFFHTSFSVINRYRADLSPHPNNPSARCLFLCPDKALLFSHSILWYTLTMATSRRDSADSYTLRARKEGYPARSVYKLEEIQLQFSVIKPGNTVLDVGAAPGSWTLYTHRKLIKEKGTIIAVDLNPLNLNPVPPTVTSYVGDAFSHEIREKLIEHGPYDAIISDAAPMTTGNRSVDTSRSEYLAEQVVRLAAEHLKPHGNLVIKIFQGGGQEQILKEMRSLFTKAKGFKPKASRSDSFEIFLIGLDRKN